MVDHGHMPLYASIRRAARITGIPRHQIRQGIADGEIPCSQLRGRTMFVRICDVEDWMRRHVVSPTDHARAHLEEVLERERRKET
jgi:excisionase family DNA binding protein